MSVKVDPFATRSAGGLSSIMSSPGAKIAELGIGFGENNQALLGMGASNTLGHSPAGQALGMYNTGNAISNGFNSGPSGNMTSLDPNDYQGYLQGDPANNNPYSSGQNDQALGNYNYGPQDDQFMAIKRRLQSSGGGS